MFSLYVLVTTAESRRVSWVSWCGGPDTPGRPDERHDRFGGWASQGCCHQKSRGGAAKVAAMLPSEKSSVDWTRHVAGVLQTVEQCLDDLGPLETGMTRLSSAWMIRSHCFEEVGKHEVQKGHAVDLMLDIPWKMYSSPASFARSRKNGGRDADAESGESWCSFWLNKKLFAPYLSLHICVDRRGEGSDPTP